MAKKSGYYGWGFSPNHGISESWSGRSSSIQNQKQEVAISKRLPRIMVGALAKTMAHDGTRAAVLDLYFEYQKQTKAPIYTSYSKLDELRLITIGLASANRIRQWAEKTLPNGNVVGEVTNANTLHHKTFKPVKGGLFCERIFGPLKDFECACSSKVGKKILKYKKSLAAGNSQKSALTDKDKILKQNFDKIIENKVLIHNTSLGLVKNYKRFFCPECDVEYTWSVMRRYQLGYIQLNAPVTHVWYVKSSPSYISLFLDMKRKDVEHIAYCNQNLTLENALKFSPEAFSTLTDFSVETKATELYAEWEKVATPFLSSGSVRKTIAPPGRIVASEVKKYKNTFYYNAKGAIKAPTILTKSDPGYLKNLAASFNKKDLVNNLNLLFANYANKSAINLSGDGTSGHKTLSMPILTGLGNSHTIDLESSILKNFVPWARSARKLKSIGKKIDMLEQAILNPIMAPYSKEPKQLLNAPFPLMEGAKPYLDAGVCGPKDVQTIAVSNMFRKKQKEMSIRLISMVWGLKPANHSNVFFGYKSGASSLENRAQSSLKWICEAYQTIIEKAFIAYLLALVWAKPVFKPLKKFKSQAPGSYSNEFMLIGSENPIAQPQIILSAVLTSQARLKPIQLTKPPAAFAKSSGVNTKFLSQTLLSFTFKKSFIWKNSNFSAFLMLATLLKYAPLAKQELSHGLGKAGDGPLGHKTMSEMPQNYAPNGHLHLKKAHKSGTFGQMEVFVEQTLLINKLCNIIYKVLYRRLRFIQRGSKLALKAPFMTSYAGEVKSKHSLDPRAQTVYNEFGTIYKPSAHKSINTLTLFDFGLAKFGYGLGAWLAQSANHKAISQQDQTMPNQTAQTSGSETQHMPDSFGIKNSQIITSLPLAFKRNQDISMGSGFMGTFSGLGSKDPKPETYNAKDVINKPYKQATPLNLQARRALLLNKANKRTSILFFNRFVKKQDSTIVTGPTAKQFGAKPKHKIVNNIYCLSHRLLWEQEKDWYFFALYNYGFSNTLASIQNSILNLEDIAVPAYDYRNYDFSLLNTLFTNTPTPVTGRKTNQSPAGKLITPKALYTMETGFGFKTQTTKPSNAALNAYGSTLEVAGKQNLHVTFSGAGMLKTLLEEFDYSELKKMDKQNRILLYDLNKYIRKVKKRITIGDGLGQPQNIKTVEPIRASNRETLRKYLRANKKLFNDLCKQRDVIIRRTKFIRKVFINSFSKLGPLAPSESQQLSKTNTALNASKRDVSSGHKNTITVSGNVSNRLASMILNVLPVLPPDLRPIVKMGTQIAASDLNRLYQRVIYRNDRLKRFLKDPTTNASYEMKYGQRLLQEAVDNLIQNGKSGVVPEKDARGRSLKSLSDILKGKQGRFRQYLLGKRVDYSGRSVIVVGPKLKLHECGIPKEMALELFLPFLIKSILTQNLARTVIGAKSLIKNNKPLTWSLLREILKTNPVLLNRAPTLHRLGFQAFQPKLVDGRAILLHPLVCPAFNADFDGDQMAVHVPISTEARAEAWKLMLSRNNLLSPATGEPLVLPSQDMVLGCYYLTTNSNLRTQIFEKGYGMFFDSISDVLRAYNLGLINIHAIIWLKIRAYGPHKQKIENTTNMESPIEIQINQFGSSSTIYAKSYTTYNYSNKTNTPVNTIIRTTAGKILFNTIIQKSLIN